MNERPIRGQRSGGNTVSSNYQAMVGKGPAVTQPYKPGSPAIRAEGNPPVTPITSTESQRLHAADHAKMALDHPATHQLLYRNEYDRILSNARGGCPSCTAFVAGSRRATAAADLKQKRAVASRAVRTQQPATSRTPRPSSYQALEQSRRAKADREAAIRIAGERAASALSPMEKEPVNEFIARREAARGAGELAFRGVPYSTAAPVPDMTQTYSFKDSGQAQTAGGPAGNGSTSPVVTVQPQAVGKRVLYNTQDAAALDAGVPAAANVPPTSSGDISLDPAQYHEGGHQMPNYPSREGATGIAPAPFVNIPPTPTPTTMIPAALTVANSGAPSAGMGQVTQRTKLEQAAERAEMAAAGDRAVANLRRYENEPADRWVARVARIRGAAELAAQADYRRSRGKV